MNDQELKDKAVQEVKQAIADVPSEPRIVHCEAEKDWYADVLCNLSEHWLNVLARGGEIIVFFDSSGKEVGWRDDGRKGTETAQWIDRESFRTFVVRELELPEETRLGQLKPRILPPVGWTHEGVFFLSATPDPDEVLRVWVDPEHNRVIQCLTAPANRGEQEDGP